MKTTERNTTGSVCMNSFRIFYTHNERQVCYALGLTFENGRGTHCFQRIVPKVIEIESNVFGKIETYTDTLFGLGCTCGWASAELGSIHDYHYDKILNLCSEIRERV